MKTKLYSFLFFFVCLASCQSQDKKLGLVAAAVFSQEIKSGNVQLIDVRTPKEFNQGHLKNASNIHLYDQDFVERINRLDKKETVYVYCKAGGRSAEAVEILQSQGFEKIIELDGGTDSWKESGLPLEK